MNIKVEYTLKETIFVGGGVLSNKYILHKNDTNMLLYNVHV